MKRSRYLAIPAAALLLLQACDDDVSGIGSSLSQGEVTITVDSLEHNLRGRSVYQEQFDSRSTTNLLGRISANNYGTLKCSFVGQLMPATSLGINDSIMATQVDSLQMVVSVARGNLTGDSLAPQRLKLFALTKQLPSDISNKFDPTGYYDPSKPLGEATYTLTSLSKNDSSFYKDKYINIHVKLPDEDARRLFLAYKDNSAIFQWPQTFAQKFPGIYVEQSFGRGCIANISMVNFQLYYHYSSTKEEIIDDEVVYTPVAHRDSTSLFRITPEVTGANCISYEPSEMLHRMAAEGKSVVTSPGGYVTRITFPAKEIIDDYNRHDNSLGIVSNLTFALPVSKIENEYGIGLPPTLLMVKTSEMDEFFRENKIPDDKTSFWGSYDSSRGRYNFTAMRDYIISLMENGKEITDDDVDFTLVPVNLVTESETNSYTGVVTTYVTRCAPYMLSPAMALLDTEHAVIVFTYSTQTMK